LKTSVRFPEVIPVFDLPRFADRDQAGRRLGAALRRYAREPSLIVLALPRGGVPVGARIAEALNAPLDVCIVRKLGVPGYEELAMGAIASGGARVLNTEMIEQLGYPPDLVDSIIEREEAEVRRRESTYRGNRPFPDLTGRTVIVVDDGAATGASMRAAVAALRQLRARKIVVALPVASREAVRLLSAAADDCVCLFEPEPFYGVGAWYTDFSQLSDAEVRALIADSERSEGSGTDLAHVRHKP
jgi:predicted phosphoribosyltransferase